MILEALADRQPPPSSSAAARRTFAWIRANLFKSLWSSLVTLALAYLLLKLGLEFVGWSLVDSVWSVGTDTAGKLDPSACRAARGVGACWAVIGDKYRLILFGRYPIAEQWRAAMVVLLFVGLFALSALPRFWRRELLLLWSAALIAIAVLMSGGVLGLAPVPREQWGGLPLTLILATMGLVFAFPLAVLVALGRQSRMLPAVRILCVLYVELIRGVPLISLLFMASMLMPLFLPMAIVPDNLLRAELAIVLFAGAYLAEAVRGGLQALPKQQYEAAASLGLTYWQSRRLVVLPQALRLVIPPLANTFISFFKDTSLVLVIGMFDLLSSSAIALADPVWQGYGVEVYVMTGLIYFCFCFSMARYSKFLERKFGRPIASR
ncbi:general L-amino acid transport system permease protein [Enhydrobacter aerosaccus]|uniref:General L-amino acid transport system permease protein n=1 Tax=Enhydrobacter aerosaccus TaxID=225324 RepID=A0A1T4P0F3_9HYPH|nr:amino acid ABC transporter permease [Enhydrobacter aerosaccus]SJZ84963.1 general L-amino acid transport system permease protein [Enhydrobacter aerosaccus]